MNNNLIKQQLLASIATKQALLEDAVLLGKLEEIATSIVQLFAAGGRLLLAGNGGSASDALHLAAEFSGRYYLDRKALPAESLTENMSAITAIANDYSFEQVFARMLESRGASGDMLWVFSTSGNSANVVAALNKAKEMNIKTIAFTGEKGGECETLADAIVKVPSSDTPRIQEAHITLGHIICEIVENEIFG